MTNCPARLLIADEKAQMRGVLRKFRVAVGYLVDTAEDAEAALASFNGSAFDPVPTDIRMPIMDGNELLTEILKIKPAAVVILMTAFGSIEAAGQERRDVGQCASPS
jgi:DNA-binding NtrC family response regulator